MVWRRWVRCGWCWGLRLSLGERGGGVTVVGVIVDEVPVGTVPLLLSLSFDDLPLLSRGQHLRLRPLDGSVFVAFNEADCSAASSFPVFTGEALFEDFLPIEQEIWGVAASGVVLVRRMSRVWPAAKVKR